MSYLELAKKVVRELKRKNVLERVKTRFGLLEVRNDGAYFPEMNVFFSNQELDLVMGKGLSRQMVDAIFMVKEKFEGEVIGCEGGLSNR